MRHASLFPTAAVLCLSLLTFSRSARTDPRAQRRWALFIVLFATALSVVVYWTTGAVEFAPLVLAVTLALARAASSVPRSALDQLVSARWFPLLPGLATVLMTYLAWPAVGVGPIVDDETAYVLQAKIFARGHWTAPAPPMPVFFDQMHVLSAPIRAAKYFPGHSLMITPGVWTGWSPAIPLLLSGISGMLVFLVARKLSNPWVAMATWWIWASAPGGLRWRASYFSEVTSAAVWLFVWWCLLKFREGSRTWLVIAAAAAGLASITRPFSAMLLGIPAAAFVLNRTRRRASWSDLSAPSAAFLIVLALVPLWSVETTGAWKLTPMEAYTRTYMPYDRLGFGRAAERERRPLPPDLAQVNAGLARVKSRHQPTNLPAIAVRRLEVLSLDLFRGWRGGLIVFMLVGVLVPRDVRWFLLASVALLIAGHLLYWHPPVWSAYYLEVHPIFAFWAAVGLWQTLEALTPASARPDGITPGRLGILALALISAPLIATDVAAMAQQLRPDAEFRARFHRALEQISVRPAIVFVRYSTGRRGGPSLVTNGPDFDRQDIWVAHDLGADDAKLISRYAARTAYVYDEETRRCLRLDTRALSGVHPTVTQP